MIVKKVPSLAVLTFGKQFIVEPLFIIYARLMKPRYGTAIKFSNRDIGNVADFYTLHFFS